MTTSMVVTGVGADPGGRARGSAIAEGGNGNAETTTGTDATSSLPERNEDVESRKREYADVEFGEKKRVKDVDRPTTTESSSSAASDDHDDGDGNSLTREKTKSTIGGSRKAVWWRVYDFVFWVPQNCELRVLFFFFFLRELGGREAIKSDNGSGREAVDKLALSTAEMNAERNCILTTIRQVATIHPRHPNSP